MDSTAETSVKSYRQMVIEDKNEFQKNSRNSRNVNINKNAMAARERVSNENKHELQVTHPLENMQKAKMNELIYLTNDTKKDETPIRLQDRESSQISRTENAWNIVERKYTKKPHYIRLGTNKITKTQKENGFAGKDKKAWFFINRVLSHVTEEQITNYIKEKSGLKMKI
ncbi:hypothetical protein WA026_008404 [Henosepilachna vigintioctopunctata]|uniref:Uncharacterized protein n=1 Tax=Henosepilachna vigintioctopunctata TaxID=420089 RepID=A0AAW1UHD7_9CUCU